MSRSTVSKSRTDKAKDKDKDKGGGPTAPAPPINSDIIPGRFLEADWNSMIEREEGEEFVIDVVGDIVDSAINVIFDNYIQKQLYPYVVTQARDLILQIIEWQFLARDEGEDETASEPTWGEEEEPLSCAPDAWAQGSVPHEPLPPLSPPVSEPETEFTSVSEMSNPEILEDPPSTFNDTCSVVDVEHISEPIDTRCEEKENTTKSEFEKIDKSELKLHLEPSKPKKPKYKPHRGPIRSAGIRSINKPLDETEREIIEVENKLRGIGLSTESSPLDHMPSSCHNILKVQTGRPPGSKDVTYDDKGNVIAVVKLNPERLPSHRIQTKFEVIDPEVEAAHARLQAMRTGKHLRLKAKNAANKDKVKQDKANKSLMSSRTVVTTSHLISRKPGCEDNNNQITPLPPPLIESMELSPGVSVREGNRIKQGPKLSYNPTQSIHTAKIKSLRPLITADKQSAPIMVKEIIGGHSPTLRPLSVTEPIPPIVPRPTPSQENLVES